VSPKQIEWMQVFVTRRIPFGLLGEAIHTGLTAILSQTRGGTRHFSRGAIMPRHRARWQPSSYAPSSHNGV